MLRLDFTYDDLGLAPMVEKTRRASVSGVQEKVQLKRVRGGYEIVASGGDAILKPVPRNTAAKFAADIPVNEHLTMRIAAKVFGIHTAENELVTLKDGEYAYLTKRFDRRDGHPIRQEDFCQLLGIADFNCRISASCGHARKSDFHLPGSKRQAHSGRSS